MGADPRFLANALLGELRSRLAGAFRSRPRPVHLLFCMVDHFEPGTAGASAATERSRMDELLTLYPRLGDAHRDSFGNRPRRTWFFPPHYHRRGNLRDLASLCERGYGEIELHLHHGKKTPDTAANLERTIRLCLQEYGEFGVFGSEGGQRRYGFIHGDWALSNSGSDGKYCGVDNELEILQRTGCYADFTFPSCNRCNPSRLNSVYYADPAGRVRRSHDRGTPVRAGASAQPGLVLIQGPVRLVRDRGRLSLGDAVHNARPLTPRVLDAWVGARIHVAGRPDWVIVKCHTHGAPNGASVLGPAMDAALSDLEARYDDGTDFVLHYVTARELYNIVKAAEAGESGNPEAYRDYVVAPPRYDASVAALEASQELHDAVYATYED